MIPLLTGFPNRVAGFMDLLPYPAYNYAKGNNVKNTKKTDESYFSESEQKILFTSIVRCFHELAAQIIADNIQHSKRDGTTELTFRNLIEFIDFELLPYIPNRYKTLRNKVMDDHTNEVLQFLEKHYERWSNTVPPPKR